MPDAEAAAERRRLARLRMLQVLDSGAEPAFDAIVRTAAAVCGVPISLISLIDEDRQWFKANVGLEGVAETPRAVAFCDHAIRRPDETMQVPDAHRDERFAANPLVTGAPHIRFYAGAPIVMPGGEAIGTLCVIGRQPHELSAAQQAALEDLALVARHCLLLREQLHDLNVVGDESRFQAVSYASPLGIFQADEQGMLFHVSGRLGELLGMAIARAQGLGWQDAVAAEDRPRVREAWAQAITFAQDFDEEFGLHRFDGSQIQVRMQARPGRWGEPPRNGFIGVMEDVTARHEALRSQQRAIALVQTVLENIPCGLAVFDAQLNVIAHNRKFRELLELPDSLFAGPVTTLEDIVRYNAPRGEYAEGTGEDAVRLIVDQARYISAQRTERTRANGTTLEIRGAPMPGGGYVTTYVDITPAKRFEQALRESEERQARAIDASRLSLWDLDLGTGRMYLSEHWSEMLGGPREPTVTDVGALIQLVPEEEQAYLEQCLTAVLKGERDRYAVEHRVRRPDGTLLWIRSEGRVTQRDGHGRATQVTGTNQDITARKTTEAQLERAAAITRATLESTADGILVMNDDREILLYNRPFLEIWRIPPELEQANAGELLRFVTDQMKDPQAFVARVDELFSDAASHGMDVLEFRDGRTVERYLQPIVLSEGSVGRVWTFRDVTLRREAEMQIEQAREAAEAANRAKSDFLHNVSHEIRTPLNGVLGMTRLLLAEELPDRQRRYVELADASAASLLALINDLLDLGKIESGRLEVEHIPFPLDSLLAQLGELYELSAAQKGLAFKLDVARGVPAQVRGDPVRVRQVLNNLLGNALKFTSQGGFGLRAAAIEGGVKFEVYDSGIGIGADAQSRLFGRFAQADSSTTRTHGGTGLGLAIVKQLCEQMGGSVSLRSEEGKGSTFTVELPLPGVERVSAVGKRTARAAPAERHTQRLLVAEDNATNQVVVQGLLSLVGYDDVTLVADGAQAVAALDAGRFDLVLMDCRMPGMDGYEATKALRERGHKLPVIALTANASQAERDRCLACGMDDFLSKPVDAQQLATALARWTGASVPAAAVPAPAAAPPAAAPGYDRARTLAQLGGDTALMRMALDSFREQGPGYMRRIREALAQMDGGELHRGLHSLAGSAGMMAATPLQLLARSLEDRVGNGELDGIESSLDQLETLVERFVSESEGW
ncbi:PAS-domain containing protein [Ramlibacter albus]|uniref:Sensory/regulatory protein RpfC n=1 Tax=Ramlibacter albus TaxID=2079448 RepID=A0A923M6I6_9BURK|nr:PAS-domain containing protein [Ramlibacter albus]MBC5763691.1 PAS-domain containing protein [Ramlibacter albus]